MLPISKVTLNVISYLTEEFDRVKTLLLNCIPENLRKSDVNTRRIQSQFGDILTFNEIVFTGKDVTNVLSHWANLLNRSDKSLLVQNLSARTDLTRKVIYIRFDKFKAFDEILEIDKGSDTIKAEIKYKAFTHDENKLENIKSTLLAFGLGEDV